MHYVKTFFRLLLGVFMTYAGFSHLTFNRLAFVAQVPMWLRFSDGFTDFVVLASGVVEIALGLAMLFPFRHKAKVGALLALFYVLIFPGNLNQYFYLLLSAKSLDSENMVFRSLLNRLIHCTSSKVSPLSILRKHIFSGQPLYTMIRSSEINRLSHIRSLSGA